jgi:hypothetical protein
MKVAPMKQQDCESTGLWVSDIVDQQDCDEKLSTFD